MCALLFLENIVPGTGKTANVSLFKKSIPCHAFHYLSSVHSDQGCKITVIPVVEVRKLDLEEDKYVFPNHKELV